MDHCPTLIARGFSVALLLSLILLAASSGATAQQPAGGSSEERDRGIQLYQQGEKLEEWRIRADSLRGFAEMAGSGSDGFKVYSSKDGTTKARVLSKPEPTYTEEPRRHQTTGTVVLKAIFAANGRVIRIHPVTYLPH